jgi:TolB-like protein
MIGLVVLLASGIAALAEKPTTTPPLAVAVYDFTDADRTTGNLGAKITALVTANLTTETNLVLLERADLTKVLNEHAFDLSGMVNADAAATIGQITGVKVLVVGQIISTADKRVIVIANIVGTETSRLFAARVEGATDQILALTTELSGKIAATITAQAKHLVSPPKVSFEERVNRIVAKLDGTKRPSVSLSFMGYNGEGHSWKDSTVQGLWGTILLKAGFKVLDESSEQKPDLIIDGSVGVGTGLRRGSMLTGRAVVDLKIKDRATSTIIAFDRQEGTATDVGIPAATGAAAMQAILELAERNLPLLVK